MKLTVKKSFRLKHPDGRVEEYHPGEEIFLENSSTLHRLFAGGFVEMPMTEGRRTTLQEMMDATICTVRDEIQAGGVWRYGPDVAKIERDVHDTYVAVLAGLKKLADYRAEVERWKRAGTTVH